MFFNKIHDQPKTAIFANKHAGSLGMCFAKHLRQPESRPMFYIFQIVNV